MPLGCRSLSPVTIGLEAVKYRDERTAQTFTAPFEKPVNGAPTLQENGLLDLVRGFGLSQMRLTLCDEIGDETGFFFTVNTLWDPSAALLEVHKAGDKVSIARVEVAFYTGYGIRLCHRMIVADPRSVA
jgi:hypothetical protein